MNPSGNWRSRWNVKNLNSQGVDKGNRVRFIRRIWGGFEEVVGEGIQRLILNKIVSRDFRKNIIYLFQM